MRANCTLLLIVVLLLTSCTPSTTAQNVRSAGIVCPKPNDFPNYMCDSYSFDYPKSNPSLRVELTPNREELYVICDYDFAEFADLPNLFLGNINILRVQYCNPSVNQPLWQSIRFLGVNSTKQLYYTNWKSKFPYTAMLFKGLQHLEQLVLDDDIEQIESGAFSNLTHLRRLEIRGKNKLKLQPGVADGLVSLSSLSLNHISEINSGIFLNLQKLKKLDLSSNKIRELRKRFFQRLQNLQHLYLFDNEIESLSADTFSLLPNLTTLDLSSNPLSDISANLTVNPKLKTFILKGNEVPLVLPDYFLAHLSELQTVDLENSNLIQMLENLFRESEAIVTLKLSNNGLNSLPESLLHDQWNLETLRLERNHLETLPEQLFIATRKLSDLQLSNNRLHSLSTYQNVCLSQLNNTCAFCSNVFAALAQLRILNLDNNNLYFIGDSTFKGTTSLEELYLQNNRLSFDVNSLIHKTFNIDERNRSPLQYLTNLRILNLHNNSITSIVHDWKSNISQLRELNLSYNAISRLSGQSDLNFVSSDINIDLSHNRISNIYELHLDQHMSLVKVHLSGNPLNCDCHLLEFVQHVEAKNKSHIQFITEGVRCSEPLELIGSITALKTLNLTCPLTGNDTGCPSKCNCKERPADLTIVVNCTGQGLAEIRSLPQPSSVNYSFIELHIEDNFFKELPTKNVLGYKNVVELHARNNLIDIVSLENLPTPLRLIDLRYNKLTVLNKSVLDTWKQSANLSIVQLSNNNWTCDCFIKDFMHFVQENHRKLSTDKSLIICENGRRVESLTVDELCNENASLLIIICVIIACSGFLLGVTSTFYYYYQIEIKVWLFKRNLFLWFVSKEELDKDKQYDAFISYSHKDALFVERELVPRMENLMNFKICIHERDWIPGEMIPEQIINSVESSRRTVIVLSKDYLQSTWAQMEFRTAHLQSLTEKRIRVIIIMFGDIGDVDSLDAELKAYLKMNTYVKHEDPWFWDKLRYAMPHPVTATEVKKQRSKRSEKKKAVMLERLEMLEPASVSGCDSQEKYSS